MHKSEMGSRMRTLGIAAGSAIGGGILTYGAMIADGYEKPRTIAPIEFKIGSVHPENLSLIEASLVTVHTTLKPEFQEQLGENLVFNCNGFIMRNAGKPFIVSAKHCLPTVIKTSDGNQYSTITQNGKSILQAEARSRNGGIYGISDAAYLDSDSSIATDLTVLNPQNPQSIAQEGITVSLQKAQAGDSLSLLRIEKSELKVVPLHVLSVNAQGVMTLIALENPENSCVKGASGSPIVNTKGELAGILSSGTENIVIDALYAAQHNLGIDYVGKTTRECYAASSNTIVNLLNTR